jgi:hypothetical protein
MSDPKPPDAIWLPIIEDEDGEYLGEWQLDPDDEKYLRATPEREAAGELLDALTQARVALCNLIELYGHESVILRKHPLPCNQLDFCVMHDANRRLKRVEAAIAKATGEKGA